VATKVKTLEGATGPVGLEVKSSRELDPEGPEEPADSLTDLLVYAVTAYREDCPALAVTDREQQAQTAVRVWLAITERPQPSAAVVLGICVDLTSAVTHVPM